MHVPGAPSGQVEQVHSDAASKALAFADTPRGAESDANSRGTNFDLPPADQPLSFAAYVFVFFIVSCGFLIAYISQKPAATLVAYYAALLPAALVFALIVYRLRDTVISKSFLLYLVFLTAVPGMIVVTIVELAIAVGGMIAVLGDSFGGLVKEYSEGINAIASKIPSGATLTPEQKKAVQNAMQAVWDHVKAKVPLWKVVSLVLIMAFAVAAFTEEMAKYLVGRRYRAKIAQGLRCHGVIACASAAALGLAGAEHVMYARGYMAQMGFMSALLEGLFRAAFAFPLHVGTTFWAGTRMARHAILKEPVSFPITILVPIFFHGSLDAFAFFASVEATSAPVLQYLAAPFNIILITLLLSLCRRSYLAVLEKEAQILDAEDADRVGLGTPTAGAV